MLAEFHVVSVDILRPPEIVASKNDAGGFAERWWRGGNKLICKCNVSFFEFVTAESELTCPRSAPR